ncbi:MAG: DUF4175 domain-containing protein [Phaeodactylibacter sp.]|nr:DUF4175 domain-containing protein [Phaeodactylibacter sp.]MCB9303188.1 DUF4175 domain-containing protein [Lewinellaceae bacterium]
MATYDNYRLLVEKLDQFIRKFYINQMIRGALYSIGLLLVLFLAMSLAEHFYYFSSGVRKAMLFSFLGISLVALGGWVLTPLMHYFRLGKVISHERAAQIIGNHFPNVKDKLLNVLQLKNQSDSTANRDLILASIDQKSEEIKLVPFKNAIDLNNNRKYLRYALPPLLLLIVILFVNANLITDSTARILNNDKDFSRPAPFSFILEEDALSVVQFEDYPLTVKVEGDILPNEVFISVDNYQYRLAKVSPGVFSYRFSNVQKDMDFRLFSTGVESKKYKLEVLEKPNVLGFDVKLDYPAYTQRKDEELSSIGDLAVPLGTNIDWVFSALNTDAIRLHFSGAAGEQEATRFSDGLFTFRKRAMKDEAYKLYISNKDLPDADSISYTLSVIPDLYPNIKAEKFQDSTDSKLLFFVGDASDDYGLLSLSFNYRIKKAANGKQGELQQVKMRKPDGKQLQFDYTFDLNELELAPGDEVTYFFEVYDNDGVNGSKSARTNLMVYAMPTKEEFEAMAEQNDDKIKDDLKKSLQEAKKVQDEMKRMREKLLQEKDMDWQSRKELEKLLDRQKELEKQIEQAKQAFEENLKNQNEFSETDEKILEKQEQLEKLMDELMSDEMRELMQKIEDMLQELGKDEALEMMENMEMSNEELENELDRMLELFKQLELEQEVQDAIDKLQELAKEQEELSQDTKEGEKGQEELQKKQEEIDDKFQDVKEKMDKIEEKNQELEQPKELGDREEQMEDIQQDINQSQQQLQQQQNNKASQSQKKASEKMKDMAEAMSMMMQSGEMEQMEEDIQALRQLLENLVGLSFDQEGLMDEFNQSEINTPRYVELVQEQFKLKDDFRLIEDSLQALSKRVFQIESYVTEKVTEVKGNMKSSLDELEERRKPQAAEHQQRTMKNVNDLALMLSEVMNQMQQQMSGMMSGNQMCNKPGGQGPSGKVPKDKISQGQEGLNQQMQRLKERMEKGMGGASSKEYAEMAARQAALRKALQDKQKKLQEQGKGSKDLQDMIDGMDKTETELVNKRLTNEMMKRQQEILTRLLEHEKAERQQEYDEKRKSEQASQQERRMPPSLEEYIKKREAEIDMYKAVSPSLKPYYKTLVDEYFKSLKSSPEK